ncbi:urease accessory protein [Verticiella sediminum]|uniref:Urease accessory protein UreD n=1 Tax=Verticiella sediminum TaxID=1247510 RepID=A0A556ARH7_9BURK|nr:urease accessory protein UreD [Verticiella sediminum]TSH95561.1 urease accessory protein [Verticiella sediminum]
MYKPQDTFELAGASDAPAVVGQRRCWRARLSVAFRRQGERTVLVRRGHEGPLAIQKPLYPEGAQVCHALILHPPGGLAAGDELDLRIDVEAGAHAVITTPGSTKWYKASPGAPATQHITLSLQHGARLDWLPQDNIYFDRSHARQAFSLRLAPGATALGWDASLLGRQASGEAWRDASLHNQTRIVGEDGRPLWAERQAVRSGDPILYSAQGLAGLPVYGTLWAAGPSCDEALAQSLAASLPFGETLRAGATALPGGILLVRAIAGHMEPLRLLFMQLWLRLRPLVHGVPAQALRIWST